MKIGKWLAVAAVSFTTGVVVLTAGATGLEQQIEDKKEEMDSLSQEASDIGETIDGLEEEKTVLENGWRRNWTLFCQNYRN